MQTIYLLKGLMNKASLTSFPGKSKLTYRAASLVGPSHFPVPQEAKTDTV